MVQLFFFLSMLTIAALMIQLFWYLEDSHKEEDRMRKNRTPAKSIKRSDTAAYSSSVRTSTQALSAGYPFYKVQYASRKAQTSAKQSFSRFYDVGDEPESSLDYSSSIDQSQCA